jgi:hypothetical protein
MYLLTRRPLSVIAVMCCLMLVPPVASSARGGGGGESERGSCSGGPGEWRLSVDRRGGGRLRVRFRIEDAHMDQSWQVFLSDNGVRIFSGTRRTDEHGELHVTKLTANRSGSDRIAASAVNSASGATCSGSVTL